MDGMSNVEVDKTKRWCRKSYIAKQLKLAFRRRGPFSLPTSKLTKVEADAMPRQQVGAILADPAHRRFLPYRCGELVIHSGLMFHQIAEWKEIIPDDKRITLQGHGLRHGDGWIIYW